MTESHRSGQRSSPFDESAEVQERRAGFIALIGAPNAGKSTLTNQLVGNKVAIVSPKVQTTRSRVLGITLEGRSQIILVDTPGIFLPRRRLDRAMVAAAWQGAVDADMVVLLIDAGRKRLDDETTAILDRLSEMDLSPTIALNKVDLTRRDDLLPLAAAVQEKVPIDALFMISALTGDGVGDLRRHLADRCPQGPWLFPEDEMTDMPMRLLAAEITREKIFVQLHKELPYGAAVETETWETLDDGSVRIGQVIHVGRDGHKPIFLGRRGQRIKAIGEAARHDLEDLLGVRVHLMLFVKVNPRWLEDPAHFRLWGLEYDA